MPKEVMERETVDQFLRFLFGMGLLLTEPRQRRGIYDRVTDRLDDVTEQASRGYAAATDRVGRLYRTARGEDRGVLSGTASFLIGVGIGAGAGVLFAPASGKKTRDTIAGKVRDFQGYVDRTARKTA